MTTPDIYKPEQWHDFFLMVGSGAAALAGLVFVAMSINLDAIVQDATHRYRAIGTLASFIATFMICALGLTGEQNHLTVGLEWLAISSVAAVIYVKGYLQAIKSGESLAGLNSMRLVSGTVCYIAQILGSILLILNHIVGLYMAAIAMVIFFAFMISGAWLLIVGARDNQAKKPKR